MSGSKGGKSGYKARYVVAAISAAAPAATTRPQGSLYAPAGSGFGLIEAHFIGAAAGTAKRGKLTKMTTRGTVGAALTEAAYDNDAPAATAEGFTTHTAGNPGSSDVIMHYDITSGVSHGLFWGFPEEPYEVPAGTANGVGFLVNATGLGVADAVFVWEE